MTLLDIRTLSVVIGAVFLSLGLTMFYYSSSNKTYKGFGKWTTGIILNGIGFILIGCHHFLPSVISVILANLLTYSGLIYIYFGFASFSEKKVRLSFHVIAVLILSLILHPFFTYFSPNVNIRVFLTSFASAFYFLLCTGILAREVRQMLGQLNKMLFVTLILITLLFVMRGAYPLISNMDLSDFMAGGLFHQLALLFTVILTILFVVGLTQLNSQLLEKELNAEQRRLSKSEDRYKRLVDQSLLELAVVQDNPFKFIFVGKPMETLTGFTQEEILGFDFEQLSGLVHPEDREVFLQRVKDRFAGRNLSPAYVCRFIHKTGAIRWVELYSTLFSHSSSPTVYVVFRDITHNKEAETALSRQSSFGKMISDISSRFLDLSLNEIDAGINQALADIGFFTGVDRAYVFLYHEDLVLADNTHEWCGPGIDPQIQHLKNIPVNTDLPWFAKRINRREVVAIPNVAELPEEAWLERTHFEAQNIRSLVVVPMVYRDRLVGFLGFDTVSEKRTWMDSDLITLKFIGEVFTNAIERKRVEKQWLESEKRWQFALEGPGDGVWDWDAQSNEVFFSRQWKAMLGYDEQDIGNSLNDWECRVHPDDITQVRMDLNRHFDGETPFYQNEHRVLCKDGSYKWILDRGKIIDWTPDEKPKRVIGTHSDISERKTAEAERENLITELQSALSEVKTLSGLLPICAICKNIRDDQGYWNKLEAYIHMHSEAQFSHSICPDCLKIHYPDIDVSEDQ